MKPGEFRRQNCSLGDEILAERDQPTLRSINQKTEEAE